MAAGFAQKARVPVCEPLVKICGRNDVSAEQTAIFDFSSPSLHVRLIFSQAVENIR